jgi:hypothetical protein
VDDPLPLPASNRSELLITLNHRKTKQFVALFVCLFLCLAILAFPHRVIEKGDLGSWIVKLNSNVTQAPRGIFFGALAVLPQRDHFECVLSPQLRKSNNNANEPSICIRDWLVMIWYGSSYV